VYGKYKNMDSYLILFMWKKFSLITETDSSTGNETCFATLFVVFKSTTQLYTLLSFGAESFVFQVAIQKFKDQDI